mmetsp:Transcript_33672/g.88502  ORF Transcript_33672/g.88502 Transcript_33672/m.88502 type:complete len:203 (-) Transcript_33672:1469-2077(-)
MSRLSRRSRSSSGSMPSCTGNSTRSCGQPIAVERILLPRSGPRPRSTAPTWKLSRGPTSPGRAISRWPSPSVSSGRPTIGPEDCKRHRPASQARTNARRTRGAPSKPTHPRLRCRRTGASTARCKKPIVVGRPTSTMSASVRHRRATRLPSSETISRRMLRPRLTDSHASSTWLPLASKRTSTASKPERRRRTKRLRRSASS